MGPKKKNSGTASEYNPPQLDDSHDLPMFPGGSDSSAPPAVFSLGGDDDLMVSEAETTSVVNEVKTPHQSSNNSSGTNARYSFREAPATSRVEVVVHTPPVATPREDLHSLRHEEPNSPREQQWEEETFARSPRESLRPYRKDIAKILFLLIVGLICAILGLYQISDTPASGVILLLIGALTLIPGVYFTTQFIISYRNGTPFTSLSF